MDWEKNEYYYALKGSTYNYLSQNRIAFLKLPPQAAYEGKSRVLTYNKYLIEHDYQPNISMVLDSNLQYFFTIQNVICYFPNLITPKEITFSSAAVYYIWCLLLYKIDLKDKHKKDTDSVKAGIVIDICHKRCIIKVNGICHKPQGGE